MAEIFFKAIAFMTGGKYIALGNAGMLPKIIIGGAEEELELEKLSSVMKEEENAIRAKDKNLTTEEVHKQVAENLAKKGVKCTSLIVEEFGDGVATEVSKRIAQCRTLQEVREYLNTHAPREVLVKSKSASEATLATYHAPTSTSTSFFGGMVDKISNFFSPNSTPLSSPLYVSSAETTNPMYAPTPTHYDYASQRVDSVCNEVSYEQVSRVMNRKANAYEK